MLRELASDQSIDRFREEYDRLLRALKASYESEKRLIQKCRELSDVILVNAARVKAAIKLTQEDAQTINVLRKEVDRAWKLVDSTKEKEERSRKIIQDLRQQVEQLNKIVDRSSDLSVGQENSVQDLIRKKEELKKENEQKQETIDGQKLQIEELLQQIRREGA